MSDFTLHLGDCLEGLAALPDKSVDHILADPPYSERVHRNACTNPNGGASTVPLGIDFTHLTDELRSACGREFSRVARRWVLVFSDAEGQDAWRSSLVSNGLEYVRAGIWVRLGTMPQITGDRPGAGYEAITVAHPSGRKSWNGGGRPAVWSHPLERDNRTHPTQKPISLMDALVRDFTDPGDLILDPFAGSGTTGVAAIRNGRRFIGWEKDPKYHAIAMKRLSAAREQLSLFEGVA